VGLHPLYFPYIKIEVDYFFCIHEHETQLKKIVIYFMFYIKKFSSTRER